MGGGGFPSAGAPPSIYTPSAAVPDTLRTETPKAVSKVRRVLGSHTIDLGTFVGRASAFVRLSPFPPNLTPPTPTHTHQHTKQTQTHDQTKNPRA